MLKLTSAYRQFFLKDEAGKEFTEFIEGLIDTAHQNAERDPDHSRDFTTKASGYRDILQHIQSVTTEVKKGRTIE